MAEGKGAMCVCLRAGFPYGMATVYQGDKDSFDIAFYSFRLDKLDLAKLEKLSVLTGVFIYIYIFTLYPSR